MSAPSGSPFAIDWFDGVDWHNEVYSPTLTQALVVAAYEMRNAVKQYPKSRHTLRVQGPNAYIVLDSDPEQLHDH